MSVTVRSARPRLRLRRRLRRRRGSPAHAFAGQRRAVRRVAGRDYNAVLPPFRAGSDTRALALRAEPSPPDGLAFSDDTGGLSRLSGQPTKAGVYVFDVVASDAIGQSGRMTVKIVIAPAAIETPVVTDKLPSFLRAYDGGACFVAVPASDAAGLDAFAMDRAGVHAFRRRVETRHGRRRECRQASGLEPAMPRRRSAEAVGGRIRAARQNCAWTT